MWGLQPNAFYFGLVWHFLLLDGTEVQATKIKWVVLGAFVFASSVLVHVNSWNRFSIKTSVVTVAFEGVLMLPYFINVKLPCLNRASPDTEWIFFSSALPWTLRMRYFVAFVPCWINIFVVYWPASEKFRTCNWDVVWIAERESYSSNQ